MKNKLLQNVMFLFVCFGLSPLTSAEIIQVEAGADVISGALSLAANGDIIELTTSGGVYTEAERVVIPADVTIRAADGLAEKPVISVAHSDYWLYMDGTGGLNLDGIVFDGTGGATATVIYFKALANPVTSEDWSLRVNDCEFLDVPDKSIYCSDGTLVPLDSVIITNTIFMGGVEEAIYLKKNYEGTVPGSYKYARIENCLITDITGGYPTYIEPRDKTDPATTEWPEVIIDHVTVDRCRDGIVVYGVSGALIQNCVVTNIIEDPEGSHYAIRAEPGQFAGVPASTVKNCIYSHGTLDLGNEFVQNVIENVDSVAAVFVDAESGNYALAAGSPGKGAGTDGLDLGFLGPYPVELELPVIASPGFEEDTAFNAWSSDWENASINEDANYVFSGSKSIKIGPPAGGRAQYILEGIPVGAQVSLLAWGIADGELNEPAWIGFYANDEFGKLLEAEGTSVEGPEMIPADEWTRLCATMTIPEGTTELQIYIWYSGDETNKTASVYVDDYEFKWGDSCTIIPESVDPLSYNSSVNVYPNPVEGAVQISVGPDVVGVSSIELFDVTGKLVTRVNDLNGQREMRLDMSSYPAGMYFGVLKSEGNPQTFKIIKKQ